MVITSKCCRKSLETHFTADVMLGNSFKEKDSRQIDYDGNSVCILWAPKPFSAQWRAPIFSVKNKREIKRNINPSVYNYTWKYHRLALTIMSLNARRRNYNSARFLLILAYFTFSINSVGFVASRCRLYFYSFCGLFVAIILLEMRIKLTEDQPNQNVQHRKNQIIPNACMKTNKIETLNSFRMGPSSRSHCTHFMADKNKHTQFTRRKFAVREMWLVVSLIFFLRSAMRWICLNKKKNGKSGSLANGFQVQADLVRLFRCSFNRQAFHELQTTYQSVEIDCINNLRVSVSKSQMQQPNNGYKAKHH